MAIDFISESFSQFFFFSAEASTFSAVQAQSEQIVNFDPKGCSMNVDSANEQQYDCISVSSELLTGGESEESFEPLFGFPPEPINSVFQANPHGTGMIPAEIDSVAKVVPVKKTANKRSTDRKSKSPTNKSNPVVPKESKRSKRVATDSKRKSTTKRKSSSKRITVTLQTDDAVPVDGIENSFVIEVETDGASSSKDETNSSQIETDTENENPKCYIVPGSKMVGQQKSSNEKKNTPQSYYQRKTFKKEQEQSFEIQNILEDWSDNERSGGEPQPNTINIIPQPNQDTESEDAISVISVASGTSESSVAFAM